MDTFQMAMPAQPAQVTALNVTPLAAWNALLASSSKTKHAENLQLPQDLLVSLRMVILLSALQDVANAILIATTTKFAWLQMMALCLLGVSFINVTRAVKPALTMSIATGYIKSV
jgi:hypothetical protein